jgi:S-adenosylmethionine-diacylglycerol 3-amino-3-carboxypropyl transferase
MDWFGTRFFKFVHGNNLVYNTCWEDPRLDRVALALRPTDNLIVITSAGCNALDYLLTGINHVFAVDMNPRQNALLELKLAGIRGLEYDDFFRMFGQGHLPRARWIYNDRLRHQLSTASQSYWDRWIKFFDNPHKSFYYCGTSGAFARWIRFYADRVVHIRPHLEAILDAKSLEEQQRIYDEHLFEKFWTRPMRIVMSRDTTLSMVGVPRAQRRQVEMQYDGGIVKYVQDCVEAVLTKLPLADNYFWRVYITGQYTPECCPEYLKPESFRQLKGGLVDRISVHTDSLQAFLERHSEPISRFVLLDHMDWLSDRFFPLLELEWQSILDRATPDARIIWRSGGLKTEFLDQVQVQVRGRIRPLPELLRFHTRLAAELHERDRVHTYASFYIAELAA